MVSGWYPGHIARARRYIASNLKICHVVFEVADSRIPFTSRGHKMAHLWKGKAHIVVMSREDLADPALTFLWSDLYQREGVPCLPADLTSSGPAWLRRRILSLLPRRVSDRLEKNESVRAMVIGLPNVGKSTFINAISGRGSAPAGRQPGVTRGQKWIAVGEGLRLLDLPGVLPPKGIGGEEDWWRLAVAGLIPSQVFDVLEVVFRFLSNAAPRYPESFSERYGLRIVGDAAGLIEEVARARGCLMSGGKLDLERAAGLILNDFQTGRLGRMTLDVPGEARE